MRVFGRSEILSQSEESAVKGSALRTENRRSRGSTQIPSPTEPGRPICIRIVSEESVVKRIGSEPSTADRADQRRYQARGNRVGRSVSGSYPRNLWSKGSVPSRAPQIARINADTKTREPWCASALGFLLSKFTVPTPMDPRSGPAPWTPVPPRVLARIPRPPRPHRSHRPAST
jgi:hypothetical protein